jgi:hypothetical protein
VLTAMVGFLVPQTIGDIFLRYWLSVAFFFCVLLTAVAAIFGQSEWRYMGLISTAVVVLVWLAAKWVGGLFQHSWLRFLGWLIVLPLAGIFVLGARDVPGALHWLVTSVERVLSDLSKSP